MIIGLMSGTSLDGLDIALCKITGSGLNTKVEVVHFETAEYDVNFKDDLRSIFSRKQVDLERVTLLNAKVGNLHAELINVFLEKHGIAKDDVDCIASHGQTIYHAPRRLHQLEGYPNATLQIGDADHIAMKTGIVTIADFRQKHIAAGGEGAPLALYGDYILFSSPVENRVLLNIGGISNFTYLPKSGGPGKAVCTDAGPGNTIIDALCKKYFNTAFDKDGHISRKGEVSLSLLEKLLENRFFKEAFPKTTGPELFNLPFLREYLERANLDLVPADLISTATQFTADSISLAINSVLGNTDFTLYVSGGGAKNSHLVESIGAKLPQCQIKNMQSLGVSADAKEAVLFAVLANETICGSAVRTKAGPAVMMGKISLPG